ncbi:helix-turn-helix domain-containing protein [Lactobacillus johnsonii]|uniref:helix-turn-helix domain-containing protein n=1 Tax=Lactobacillus johnsonii TaxID=33959 RepID=UPI001C0F3F49|nr:helix-turn-helix transcriptional regulator [Lactobacillus johnsonii]MBU5318979.1 helix-turn-helix domain-containing protein [Lactobacillus johnsonii]
MTTFERIKKYAKLRGLSLQKVALAAGLSKNMIYQYKDGTNPSMKTLNKIADVLHVEPNDLLSDTTNKENTAQADLDDDDTIFTFQGKPIPPEDLKIIRRLLKNDDE